MATTGERRRGSSSLPAAKSGKGGPSPVYLGVLWGYPFSLVRRLALVFICVLAFCFAGAYILSQPTQPLGILVHLAPVALAILLALYVAELVCVTERPLPPLTVEALFWAIATACIVMGLGYAIVPTYAPSSVLACAAPVVAALAVYVRRKWMETRGAEEERVRTVIFAGTREEAARGMANLADATGVYIHSVLLPKSVRNRSPMAGLPVRTPEEAIRHLRDEEVRLVLVAKASPDALGPLLAACAGAGCVVEKVDELVAKSQGRINLDAADDIRVLNRLSTRANRFPIQRLLDLLLVLLAVPIAFVPALLAMIAIKLTSRGPILFKQKRVGRWGREFTMLKFRTMRVDAERDTGPVWAKVDDPRVTPVGGLLRRTRIDELPQLLNVFAGRMSLVGPRPERRFFVDSLREQVPLYDARHAVRPGITGWAQIRVAYGANVEDARNKLTYELFYIFNRSLTFYFTVLLETVKVLLFRRGGR